MSDARTGFDATSKPLLFANYWTLAGDCSPGKGSGVSPRSFADRVTAAREAGFAGLGLNLADFRALETTLGVSEMRAILTANETPCMELEVLRDWFASGDRRMRSDVNRRDILRAAGELETNHIKVVGDLSGDAADKFSTEMLAEEFGALCDQALEVGTKVVLEPAPFSAIRTLARALEIIEGAGRPNGGLLIDVWHMERGLIPNSDVAALPKGSILWVELDDASSEQVGSIYEDTINNRRLCGEGDFRLTEFINAVRQAGYDGGFGIEIISEEQRKRPLAEGARRAFETAMKQFEDLAS